MDELISRQQAIDAFNTNVDELVVAGKENADSVEKYLNRVIDKIKELPSAQSDIIYCGECTKMKVDSIFHDCWCSETGKKVWINHYCGYAERREVTE